MLQQVTTSTAKATRPVVRIIPLKPAGLGPGGPSVGEIGAAGGRRVSTGGALASTAYGALMIGAHELLSAGTSAYRAISLRREDRSALGA